jgi:spore coat polysaccharide biosynthesis protein SpsF
MNTQPRVVAVVQARMGSTRLPGKVMKPLRGCPVLEHVVRRVSQAKRIDGVVVATTLLPEDHRVEELAGALGADVVRGSVDDVLSRYCLAARASAADHVVRITADCPCSDPAVIDRVVAEHLSSGADYTSNVHPRSFPHGLDLEAVRVEALETAAREARTSAEREHVMPFIWSRPDRFRLHNVAARREEREPGLRITLDTADDYVMLQALFDLLGNGFSAADVVAAARRYPWLPMINGNVRQKLVLLDENPAVRARQELVEAARWSAAQELFYPARLLLEAVDQSRFPSTEEQLDAQEIKTRCERLAEERPE